MYRQVHEDKSLEGVHELSHIPIYYGQNVPFLLSKMHEEERKLSVSRPYI